MSGGLVESSVALIRRAKAGEDAALDELLRRYLPRLRRWASGRLPANARGVLDTNDLIQDAVLQALRHLGDFDIRGDGAFHAYLRQSLLNRLTDVYRRGTRRGAAAALGSDLIAPGQSPLDAAIGAENVERYEKCLAALRNDEREAVILRLEFGCSYQEVAYALGKPSAGAARVAVSRAIARLARDMSHDR